MAETVPGGRYLGGDGKLHDAHGKPVADAPEPEEATAKTVKAEGKGKK